MILVDFREKNSFVLSELIGRGQDVKLEHLEDFK